MNFIRWEETRTPQDSDRIRPTTRSRLSRDRCGVGLIRHTGAFRDLDRMLGRFVSSVQDRVWQGLDVPWVSEESGRVFVCFSFYRPSLFEKGSGKPTPLRVSRVVFGLTVPLPNIDFVEEEAAARFSTR